MLETVDLDARLKKKAYQETQELLDLRLGELQRRLRAAGIPVLIVFEGWDAAGKGSVLGRLLRPIDSRGYKVHNMMAATPQESLFPPMRRFWLQTPANGTIAIYNHSWYRQVLDERVAAEEDAEESQPAYERMRVFERQLSDDGAVVAKFFLHISKKEQGKRFKQLEADPAYAWKVGKKEKKRHKQYAKYYRAVEDMLRETSTPYAPWNVVPATDERYRNVHVAEALVALFEKALAEHEHENAAPAPAPPRRVSPLDKLDMSLSHSRDTYKETLDALQLKLRRLQHLCYIERRPVIIAYEGWDASGKGGNIRRVIAELDPRGFEVIPIAAPEGEEKHHHHLWRFWRAMPKAGHFTIFDRTWYGRVLVERIEGFATPAEWQRAYREINEFEEQLVDYGALLFKFWLHITTQEQHERFVARQNTPHKAWKITDEDWRNRERWDEYWNAVSEMIERTSTIKAPWVLIEGNDKRHARLKVLRTLVGRLKRR